MNENKKMSNKNINRNKNKSKAGKINIDLVPEEYKNVLDLHGLTVDESKSYIDQEFLIVESMKLNTKVFILLHGYSSGEILKKYIRNEYKNKNIEYKDWGQNPGITYFILKGR